MMKKEPIKAGFAGSGFAARFQYDALMRSCAGRVEVAGVFSPTAEHADAFAKSRGIRAFGSLEELVGASDVVHVCTPPSSHEKIAVAALEAGKDVIVEKPFTGWFGDGSDSFCGESFDREEALEKALESARRMLDAEKKGGGRTMYAENWIYAPAIQKEAEIVRKSGCQILWMHGEQSHSGSHSPSYGIWRLSGGGSLIGKGSHPIGAVLFLKQTEGMARNGVPIRAESVSARTHALTRMPSFIDSGHIRTSYTDIEDFASVHIVFEDGTVADIFANEVNLGGTVNTLTVCANNHKSVCNMSHNDTMETYTPDEAYYEDVYVVEKTETKQGWSKIAPEEGWFLGYQHEIGAFYDCALSGKAVESNGTLAADTVAVIYSAYLSAARSGAEVRVERLR